MTRSPVLTAAVGMVLDGRTAALFNMTRDQLAEALDEVERLRGVVERLELEKFDLAERLMKDASLRDENERLREQIAAVRALVDEASLGHHFVHTKELDEALDGAA